MRLCIERPDTQSSGAVDFVGAELLVDEGGALEAGSAGYVVIAVEDGSDVGGFETFDVKADDADVIGWVILAIEDDVFVVAYAVDETLGELHFAMMDCFHALTFEPADSGEETDDTDEIGGAVFETVGVFFEMMKLGGFDACSACAGVADIDTFANVEAADSGGPEQRFVSGKSDDVDVLLFNVYRDFPGSLGGINEEDDTALLTELADLGDGLDCTDDVGGVVDYDEPRGGLEERDKIFRVDEPVVVEGNVIHFYAVVLLVMMEGTQHRVVLDVGGDNMIASREQSVDSDVERFGGIEREDKPIGIISIKKFGHGRPCLLDDIACLYGQITTRSPGADTVAAVKAVHHFIHLIRLGK